MHTMFISKENASVHLLVFFTVIEYLPWFCVLSVIIRSVISKLLPYHYFYNSIDNIKRLMLSVVIVSKAVGIMVLLYSVTGT